MRRVAIQLTGVIRHDMVSGPLMLGVISERPVDELRRVADKNAMIVDGVGVIHGEHQLAIEAIDAATVAMDAIEYLLPIEQLTQGVLVDVVGPMMPLQAPSRRK